MDIEIGDDDAMGVWTLRRAWTALVEALRDMDDGSPARWARRALSDVDEALNVDPTGALAAARSEAKVGDLADTVTFPLSVMADDPDLAAGAVRGVRAVRAAVGSPGLVAARAAFAERTETYLAQAFGGTPPERVREFAASPEAAGIVMDAVRAARGARIDTVVGPSIIGTPAFEDEASWFGTPARAVAAVVARSRPGVSVHFLDAGDARRTRATFAVGVRSWDGASLVRFPGDHAFPHPVRDGASRPWEDDDVPVSLLPSRPHWADPGLDDGAALGAVSDLPLRQLLWTAFVVGEIGRRIRGETRASSVAIAPPARGGLPAVVGFGLDHVPTYAPEVSDPDLAHPGLGDRGPTPLAWMVERAGVPDDVDLAPVGATGGDAPSLVLDGPTSPDGDREDGTRVHLETLRAGRLDTADAIEADRIHTARLNLARAATAYAVRERDLVRWSTMETFAVQCRANLDWFLEGALVAATADGGRATWRPDGGFRALADGETPDEASVVAWFEDWEDPQMRYGTAPTILAGDGPKSVPPSRACVVTGSRAAFQAGFRPSDAVGLAAMRGIGTDALEPYLARFGERRPQTPNSNLHRVDPFRWALKDPWSDRGDFGIEIPLSKTGLSRLRKNRST